MKLSIGPYKRILVIAALNSATSLAASVYESFDDWTVQNTGSAIFTNKSSGAWELSGIEADIVDALVGKGLRFSATNDVPYLIYRGLNGEGLQRGLDGMRFYFKMRQPAPYLNDWESATKTSYVAGIVIINGIRWKLTDALIGTSATDIINGTRSVRGRGYGSTEITMVDDIHAGLSDISFDYRSYSTDEQIEWIAEYSTTSGAVWNAIGAPFTPGAEVTTFSNRLDINEKARIRIRPNQQSGSSNRRANFDDIRISPFNAETFKERLEFGVQISSNGTYWSDYGPPISADSSSYRAYYHRESIRGSNLLIRIINNDHSMVESQWLSLDEMTIMVPDDEPGLTPKGIRQVEFVHDENLWRIQIINDTTFRVTGHPGGATNEQSSLMVKNKPGRADLWYRLSSNQNVRLNAGSLLINVNASDGSISVSNRHHQSLFSTTAGILQATNVLSVPFYSTTCEFQIATNQYLYGLGQNGIESFNIKGREIRLAQENTVAISPFVLSSAGYGILWDNYSESWFRSSNTNMSFSSSVADHVDYYVIFGPGLQDVIRGYRSLTGEAPMLPRWAYGYIQSWNWYTNRANLLEIVEEHRRRELPLDCIVQDAGYWGRPQTGNDSRMGFEIDTSLFPDPAGMIDLLKTNYNCQYMISLWPFAGTATVMHAEMKASNHFFTVTNTVTTLYDPFNPSARSNHWRWLKKSLFDLGVDAWWMDATEPEFNADSLKIARNHLGPNARYLNAYSLMAAKGAYEGQRATTNAKRVFTLSRSTYAGQQRYSAATWSGDIRGTWDVLRQQIANGLNYSMSGMPYWTTDIGGFFVGSAAANQQVDYRNLYVRWFQFGAFSPLFRSHGQDSPREIWRFGEPGTPHYDALVKFSHLRSRLMPYIYSSAWRITRDSDSMMRPLPLEFIDDPNILTIADQYMFGPSIMVAPLFGPTGEVFSVTPSSLLFNKSQQPGSLSGTYFNRVNLEGSAGSRIDPVINFDWPGSPMTGVPNNNFSVRWTGYYRSLSATTHYFRTISDDGVRLWIDNKLIINKWINQAATAWEGSIDLEPDRLYPIRLEFYDSCCDAAIKLYHGAENAGDVAFSIIPPEHLYRDQEAPGGLKGDYFTNTNLGNSATQREDSEIDFTWPGSPATGVNSNNFSVRWEGFFWATNSGFYVFRALADDGVRLWLNGVQLIDGWKDQAATYYNGRIFLDGGKLHPIRLEMYDRNGDSRIQLAHRFTQDEFDTDITKRRVHLPRGHVWYDFWTGKMINGGRTITVTPPLDQMPIYVKAGSIIPMGPVRQYVAEHPDAPIELRVYPGRDAKFTLYEDEGDSYNYEGGLYSEIDLAWRDQSGQLEIASRRGGFPGMHTNRDFNVVIVSTNTGIGIEVPAQSHILDQISYAGSGTQSEPISLNRCIIQSPTNNAQFMEGSTISFVGTGETNQPVNSLVWYSNAQAGQSGTQLGRGSTISVTNLKPGIHVVSLSHTSMTDQIYPAGVTIEVLRDANRNRIPDDWELLYADDLFRIPADIDDDLDGYTTYEEYLAGTNPFDDNSQLAFEMIAGQESEDAPLVMQLLFSNTVTNRFYDILWSTNLSSEYWIGMNYRAAGTGGDLLLPIGPITNRAFYRGGAQLP